MSSWLFAGGAVVAILCVIGLIVLGIMFAQDGQWWCAAGCVGGIAVVVFAAFLGDMYATGWWDK